MGRRTLQELLSGHGEAGGRRVFHLIPALFTADGGVIGGAERYAYELARHMAERVPTTLLTFGPAQMTETQGTLDVRILQARWYAKGQRTNPFAPTLFKALRQAELLHCHQQFVLASSLGALYCRLTGRRAVVTHHGGGGFDLSQYVPTKRIFERHLHVSEFSRRIMRQEAAPWSHVVWGGVDIGKFSPDPTVRKSGSVLYVGRLMPHKGVNYLIEGLPEGLALDVVGPPVNERFVADLRKLAEGKKVRFHHSVDDSQLIHHYRSALCIVLPSVHKTMYGTETVMPELLGQTLLEGMACGLPTLCTRVAAMPEVVTNGVDGFTVPPNDAAAIRERLLWFRDHPEEVAVMGARARQRVLDKFSWGAVVDRCLEVYRTLL